MSLDFLKELTPVFYNQHGIKAFERIVGFSSHWHDRMECILIKKGSLEMQIRHRHYTAKAGDMVIIPPTVPHSSEPGKDSVVYRTIMFEPENFVNDIPNVKQHFASLSDSKTEFVAITNDTEIVDTFLHIYQIQESKSAVDSLVVSAHIYTLLALLCARCAVGTQLPKAQKAFSGIIAYIQEHYDQPLTSSFLCDKFGYSQGYFSRRFIAETGMSPTAFIRTVRLENAAQLLSETSTPIRDIAVQCGFQDTKYFNRCFRELYGITPSRYRAAALEGGENFA